MENWEQMERVASEELAKLVDAQPFDRAEAERMLHVFAMGKNRRMDVQPLDHSILSDGEVRGMVRALLAGNRVGF
ncbi:MAG TPA: hypothetical protein VK501_24785 [Baekduia sp.]|uniref:hypothetical protein n=1 Tax=Baekduia sp. TaxID=2600305 RepID=UPI002C646B8C|nr:hypothetical protein [Baekduia sp.]HMJ37145.1 hypothetical protein [Baekduia sp.]